MEEWQNPDSGYLNCIGVGDNYVKRQMERIMKSGIMETRVVFRGSVSTLGDEV